MTGALYRNVLTVLFVLFFIANSTYLHRVPGLLGDEGSEGENVFELLDKKELVVVGERSYIGPAIDYVRVPFVVLLGYSALSLRVVMLLFSCATFWLAAVSLRRLFGRDLALFVVVFFMFSPVYLLYERLGWAISLYPFFTFLTVFFLTSRFRGAAVLAGFAAGLGLANHIVFLPTLVGIAAGTVVYVVPRLFREPRAALRSYLSFWPSVFGFLAGFGMQLAVLGLFREDQGDPGAVAGAFFDRLAALPLIAPLVLSGSSFTARYTGFEFAPLLINGIVWALVVLCGLGLLLAVVTPFLLSRRILKEGERETWLRALRATFAWGIGLAVYTVALLYVIDRFTLRYFVTFVLGVWGLAGLGVGYIFWWLFGRFSQWLAALPVAFAVLLMVWVGVSTLVPFLATGGSVADFSLGNRTDSASAFVDVRPLVACLRGAGPVFSESVHIWNRLQYLSHSDPGLEVVTEEHAGDAQWLVHYRLTEDSAELSGPCPSLRHFRVVPQ